MVVGKEVSIEEVSKFYGKTLVGRLCGKDANGAALGRLTKKYWNPLIGYVLETHIMVRGFSCFIF